MSSNKNIFTTFPVMLFFLVVQNAFNNAAAAEKITQKCEVISNAFDRRLCVEQKISKQPFVLIPYKPNYFVGSYVKDMALTNPVFDNFESKFQISFKTPLSNYEEGYRCLWFKNTHCYTFFGYTQVSVWQMLNLDHSAPFRDTNFEPELMISQLLDKKLFADWKIRLINYGLFDHQSNGKSPPGSRSWNRSYIDIVLENNRNYITFKYWKRWSEGQKTNPNDFEGDDNPFIEDYVGNVELKYFYAGRSSNCSIVIRDSKKNKNKINYELNWSYPINKTSEFKDRGLRFYIQYFNGFGETLIDYNVKRERLGIGLMLTDWL